VPLPWVRFRRGWGSSESVISGLSLEPLAVKPLSGSLPMHEGQETFRRKGTAENSP
jgi:hypothetical protein